MLLLAPQLRIMIAILPIDFRFGVDRIASVCRQTLNQNPFDGTLFVFKNRSNTAIRLLCYDGGGYWIATKRFSKGKLKWWPSSTGEPLTQLAAKQLQIMLYNGLPDQAQMDEDWRKLF